MLVEWHGGLELVFGGDLDGSQKNFWRDGCVLRQRDAYAFRQLDVSVSAVRAKALFDDQRHFGNLWFLFALFALFASCWLWFCSYRRYADWFGQQRISRSPGSCAPVGFSIVGGGGGGGALVEGHDSAAVHPVVVHIFSGW
jgi:hypothetical protein